MALSLPPLSLSACSLSLSVCSVFLLFSAPASLLALLLPVSLPALLPTRRRRAPGPMSKILGPFCGWCDAFGVFGTALQ